jgi:CheY-like chemotaxis protein
MMNHKRTAQPISVGPVLQKVVVVSRHEQMNEVLESVLDAGHYDVVFVESAGHAYSQVKRVAPDLVIVCLDIDDLDGFRVLSMLKLDSATRRIPVVTCTTGGTPEDSADDSEEPDEDAFAQPSPVSLN